MLSYYSAYFSGDLMDLFSFSVLDTDENNADFHVSVAYRPGESGVYLI